MERYDSRWFIVFFAVFVLCSAVLVARAPADTAQDIAARYGLRTAGNVLLVPLSRVRQHSGLDLAAAISYARKHRIRWRLLRNQ